MENENKNLPLTPPVPNQSPQEPTLPIAEVAQPDVSKKNNKLKIIVVFILVTIVLLFLTAFAFWFSQKRNSSIKESIDSQKEIELKAPAVVTTTPKYNLSVYENLTHRIKLTYPQDWIKTEGVELEKVRAFSGLENTIVEFHTKQKPNERVALVMISIEDLSGKSTTLEEYTGIEDFKQSPDYNIIEFSKTSLAQKPAYKNVHDYVDNKGIITRTLLISMIDNNKGYLFGYNAHLNIYKRHINEVQNMIDSFELY